MQRLIPGLALSLTFIAAPVLALAVTVTDITPDLGFPTPAPDSVTKDDTGIDN